MTFSCKNIGIRKSDFVAKAQFLSKIFNRFKEGSIFVTEFIWKKELSLCHKLHYSNPNIFRTRCCKPLLFQTQTIWSHRFNSLKYLKFTTFGSKDIVIRKSEFVAKTQFLWNPKVLKNINFQSILVFFQKLWFSKPNVVDLRYLKLWIQCSNLMI